MSLGVVLPAFPTLATDLGLGASGISLLLAVPSATRLLFNLPMGRQADKSGRVRLMVAGEFLAGAGVAFTGLAASLASILAARFLVGAGGAMASAGSHAYLADFTQTPNVRPHRGSIIGLQSAAFNAAWIAGPVVGGLMCEIYGPRLGFIFVGAAIAACGLAYATLPETLRPAAGRNHAKDPLTPPLARRSLLALLSDPTQQGVMAAHFALTMNYAAMAVVIPLHAAAVWGATAGQIGALFSAIAVISLVAAPLAGWLADRWGRKVIMMPSLLLMASGSLVMGFASGFPSFVLAAATWALGEACFVPPTNALTVDCAPPSQKGETLALSRQFGDVGFALGPVILGLVYDAGGPIAALGMLGAVNLGTVAFVAARITEALAAHHVEASKDGLAHVLEEKNI